MDTENGNEQYSTSQDDPIDNVLVQTILKEINEAKDNNDELFLNESADLLFHYLMLLQAKGFLLHDVIKILQTRGKKC